MIALAFVAALRDTSEIEAPSALRWGVAVVGVGLFLLLASESYALLLPRPLRPAARAAFLTSQLVKYNPVGGPAQMVSQMAMNPEETVDSVQTVMRSKLTAVAGGLAWAPICAVSATGLPWLARIGIGLAGLGVVIGHPAVIRWVFRVGSRWSSRVKVYDVDRSMIVAHLRSTVVAAAAVGFSGVAFAALINADRSATDLPWAVSAYALAWTIGYLAVPIPGGIGVREAALVVLAPFEPSEIVVAAVLLRLTQVAVEIAFSTAGSGVVRRIRSRSKAIP